MKKFTLLTRMIFDYWKIWLFNVMGRENDDYILYLVENDGLDWYDGHVASFWYMLNLEWFRMNNKLKSHTDCKVPFDYYLRDFDEDYIKGEYGGS